MGKKPTNLHCGLIKIPEGWVALAWSNKGISSLLFPKSSPRKALAELKLSLSRFEINLVFQNPVPVPHKYSKPIQLAFAGRPYPVPATDVSFMTLFQKKVLRATSKIPRGTTRTYGWVASQAGSPKAYRAVGQALTSNPVPIFIPCHRVVAAQNRLGGYGSGISWKIRLLKDEGIHLQKLSNGEVIREWGISMNLPPFGR